MSALEVRVIDAFSRRVRVHVGGTVQGVGFRPHVYRLAQALDLAGFVLNDASGVEIEVQGEPAQIDRFLERLPAEAPPLATVQLVSVLDIPLEDCNGGRHSFRVVTTSRAGEKSALVSPDTATCADCLKELFDPDDRRYRYPFVNCTNCGPRFSIVRTIPYDRPFTTMAAFEMCDRCRREYEDPGDRRFHAQPNACADCGPMVTFLATSRPGIPIAAADDGIRQAAAALRSGAIVAVKGLGGYHLACVATDATAVQRLRSLKHREEKPFAVMASNLECARELVDMDEAEERLLSSRARPIVLAARRETAEIADAVAPRCRELGVVLPYTPLHHLLLADAGVALVMTSGNRSDEPIAYRDDDALERLSGIADYFLTHNRIIHTRVDDSIARVVTVGGERRTMILRRSRGYAPSPLALPVRSKQSVLACGGHLKNTYCMVRGSDAFLGPHVGDLENLATLQSFTEGIDHLGTLVGIEPAVVAHDMHPDYLSTRYATEREACGLRAESIQHHHAHLAACLAEHGITGPAVGIVFDGTGYGTDGTVWGGEVLVGDLTDFERVGFLYPVRLPGGAAAIREPWRMACSWLTALEHSGVPAMPASLVAEVDEKQWASVSLLCRNGIASPITTSVGRLLDAISAMCGVRARVSYEGQAAIELEARVDRAQFDCYSVDVQWRDGEIVMNPLSMLSEVVGDLRFARPVEQIATLVHNGLANAAAKMGILAADKAGLHTVALAGGVFQNTVLLQRTAALLERSGYQVLIPEGVPANDGGLAFGQAAVAAVRSGTR